MNRRPGLKVAALAGFLAIVYLVPFNSMPGLNVRIGPMTAPIGWVVVFPIGAALLASSAWTFARQRRVPALAWWTMALSGSLVASCAVAEIRGIALSTAAGFIVRCVAVAWAAYLIGGDGRSRSDLLAMLTIIGAVVAAGAVFETISGKYFLFERRLAPDQHPYEVWPPGWGVAVGAIGQPLPFSALMNLLLPVAVWRWTERRSVSAALPALLILAAIVMTFRRSAYAVALATSAIVLIAADRRLTRPAALAALVVMVAAFMVPATRTRIMERFNPVLTIKEMVGGHRTLVYGTTWKILKERPVLGLGTRQYERLSGRYAAYYGAANTPDNQYLRMAVENGIVGLAALLGFAIWLMRALWRRRGGDGLPLLVSCGSFLLILLVLDGLYYPATGMTFFALAGAGCGASDGARDKR